MLLEKFLLELAEEAAIEVRRIAPALRWVHALMQRQIDGVLGRTVSVEQWFGRPCLRITADASPWGLGAWLSWDDTAVA